MLDNELYNILLRIYNGEKFRSLYNIYTNGTDEEKSLAKQLEHLYDCDLIYEVVVDSSEDNVYFGATHFGKYVVEQTQREKRDRLTSNWFAISALIISIVSTIVQIIVNR